MDVGKLLFMIHWNKKKAIEKRLPQNITPLEFKVMFILCKKNSTQKELGDKLGLTKGTVSKTVSSLEDKGFIKRVRGGRSCSIKLTEKGKSLRKKMEEIHVELEEIMFKNFSDKEKTELIRLLSKILKNLGENHEF